MKVLLCTNTGTYGVGGHLYTVKAHAEALSAHAECAVLGWGTVRSPALDTLSCPVHHVLFGRGRTRLRELAEVLRIVRTERPDVIHAFDTYASGFARVAAQRFGCRLVLTICGGPNPVGRYPQVYVPRVRRLVLFSEENEQFYRNWRRFRSTQIWRIPNRVNEITADMEKVRRVRSRLDPQKTTILRIGRFTEFYEETARQCIRLVKRLAADGIQVQLALLGVVQSAAVYAALQSELDGHGVLISEPDLTAMGSAVLDAGDLVAGTGRGLMEAAARGRVLLAPVRAAQHPALVTEANWKSLARANFSERAFPDDWDEEANYAAIRRVLRDSDCRTRVQAFSRALFEQQFSLSAVMGQYLEIYGNAEPRENRQPVDLLMHWFWLMWRTRGWMAAQAARTEGLA